MNRSIYDNSCHISRIFWMRKYLMLCKKFPFESWIAVASLNKFCNIFIIPFRFIQLQCFLHQIITWRDPTRMTQFSFQWISRNECELTVLLIFISGRENLIHSTLVNSKLCFITWMETILFFLLDWNLI